MIPALKSKVRLKASFHIVTVSNATSHAVMPSVRILIVEFRSLLSPPMRLPLRALHTLFRPRCLTSPMGARRPPQCLEQRRNLVLYKTAKADTVLGMHKLLPFDLYQPPPFDASEHLVRLETDGKVIEEISLQDIYHHHVRPGRFLYLKEGPTKTETNSMGALQEKQLPNIYRTYGIFQAETLAGNKKEPHAGKGKGALRTTPLNLSSPAAYFIAALDRSYQFVKHESPVEFVMAITRKADKDKKKRLAPAGMDTWHWTHEHFPHLRPDFILKSMPKGSRYVIDPVSDGKRVQFVIAASQPAPLELGYSPGKEEHIPFNLTKRLFAVKGSVQKSIREGKQAQLPAVYRQMLHDSGNMSYHRRTNMPITKEEHEGKARDVVDAEVAYDDALSGLERRYMPEMPQEDGKPAMRMDKLNKAGHLMGPVPARVYQRRSNYKAELLAQAMSPKNGERWQGRGAHNKVRKMRVGGGGTVKLDLGQ